MRRSFLCGCSMVGILVLACGQDTSTPSTDASNDEGNTGDVTTDTESGAETQTVDSSPSGVEPSDTEENTSEGPVSSESNSATSDGTAEDESTSEVTGSSSAVTESSSQGNETTIGNGSSAEGSDSESSADSGDVTDDTSDSSARLTPMPVGSTDAELGYWEYLPPNYGEEPLPLLIFTHGAGWMGDGSLSTLETTLNDKDWPLVNLMRDDRWPNSRPFIVLAPQNPHSGCFQADDIDAFYRYAVENYEVDMKRIYHTGQSCGAVGAMDYLGDHLDEFVAAAVIVSLASANAGFSTAGCDLGRVAIWALHNENDQTTGGAAPSIDLVNNLLACTPVPDAKLTVYPDATEHDAWTKTYDLSAGNDVFGWLLEHQHP